MSLAMYDLILRTALGAGVLLIASGIILVFYKALRRSSAPASGDDEGAQGGFLEGLLPAIKASPGLAMIFVGAGFIAGLLFVPSAIEPPGLPRGGICADLTYARTSGADGGYPETLQLFVGALNAVPDAGSPGAPSREEVGQILVRYLQTDGAMRGNLVHQIVRMVSDPADLIVYCRVESGEVARDRLTASQELSYRRVENLVTKELAP
ncbi:hypothetical protein [Salinarimonas sp.]|uniref:hypothetical protein n=1 Tax=Salinarimonas sp. TaxID=2766526 RepID=UPI0032D97BBB